MIFLLILMAVPFPADALGNSNALGVADARMIRLVRGIFEDEVIAEFVKSDFENVAYRRYHEYSRGIV